MKQTRVVLYILGVTLVVVSLLLLFFETGLNRWVPVGIAIAAMLLIVGLAIVSLGERGGGQEDIRMEERHVDVAPGHRHQD